MIGEGGADSGANVYNGSMEPMLVSASNLYSEDEEISVGNNKHSSYPVYNIYWLLCLLTTALRKNVNNFGLRRLFYSR